MGKKEEKEKKLLRDILEQEELLMDTPDKKIVREMLEPKQAEKTHEQKVNTKAHVAKAVDKKDIPRPHNTAASPGKKPLHAHSKEKGTKAVTKFATKPAHDDEGEIKELLEQKVEQQFIPGLAKPRKAEPVTLEQHEIMPYRSKEDPSHAEELQNAFDNYPKVHRKRIFRISLIILIIGLALIFFLFKTDLIETGYNMTRDRITWVPSTQNITPPVVEEKISFSVLAGTTGRVTVTGFLKYSVVKVPDVQVSMHIFSLVDDYGNEIRLSKLTNQQQQLFVLGQESTQLYEVTGTLSKSDGALEVKVDSLKPGSRPIKAVP
jgi:hypothetical protein